MGHDKMQPTIRHIRTLAIATGVSGRSDGSRLGSMGRRQAPPTPLEIEHLERRDLPAALGILVPAYFDPTPGSPWNQIAAAGPRAHITAIMNPDSGPGTQRDPSYVAAVAMLHKAGERVLGYIHTSYGQQPLKEVFAEINDYRRWYHVDGIFLDEMTSDASAAHLRYYLAIDSDVHRTMPHSLVVGNPGTNTPRSYTKVADALVLFEDGSGYNTYTPLSWQASLPASRFANIVYDVPTVARMQADVNLAVARHTGWIYVTNETLPNPYEGLPSYWSSLVAAVAAS